MKNIIIENSKNIIVLSPDLNNVGENPIINLEASPARKTTIATLLFKFLNINKSDNAIDIKFTKANTSGTAYNKLLLVAGDKNTLSDIRSSPNEVINPNILTVIGAK